MAKKDLAKRLNWQHDSGARGLNAEWDFYNAMKQHFENTDFEVISKPKDFEHLYENFKLPDDIDKRVYHPKELSKTGEQIDKKYKHGFIPDYAIKNKLNGKTLYVEVKRQDGWVEGKKPSAGRGNVHERSCKYHTPGLLKAMREKGHISDENTLPFWVVFIGDITRDPKRTREIHFWYQGKESYFFLWDDLKDPSRLTNHFDTKLKNLLI